MTDEIRFNSYDDNPIYNADKFGFEIVANWDAYDPDYDFDIILILKKDGKLWLASDSGCSCPTPFEDHTFPSDFTQIRSWDEAKAEIDARFPQQTYSRVRKPLDSIRRAVQRAL